MRGRAHLSKLASIALLGVAMACNGGGGDGPDTPPDDPGRWRVVSEGAGGAFMSVWGRSADDVYVVGGDPGLGTGPTAFHLQGGIWQSMPTAGMSGALNWVFGPAPETDAPVWMVGAGGAILRHDPATDATVREPSGLSDDATLWGVWGQDGDTLYAVGDDQGLPVLIRRDADGTWVDEPTPAPAGVILYKVWGDEDGIWAVGSGGAVLRHDGSGWSTVDLPEGVTQAASLLTFHGDSAVGQEQGGGVILTVDADRLQAPPLPEGAPALNGVRIGQANLGDGVAVGGFGAVLLRTGGAWTRVEDSATQRDLHAAWIDDRGDIWACGGEITGPNALRGQGVLVHHGEVAPLRLFRGR